jgi:hypothetical protein
LQGSSGPGSSVVWSERPSAVAGGSSRSDLADHAPGQRRPVYAARRPLACRRWLVRCWGPPAPAPPGNFATISPTALADRLAGPGERATHVLVADPGHGATYDDLDAAFRALRSEAQLVTTQVNRIARRDDGEHLDTGGWVRLLEYATGQTARVLGKPSPEFLTAPPERARPRGTERAGGRRRPGRRRRWPHGRRGDGAGPQRQGRPPQPGAGAEPDAVVDSVADLPGLLQA